MSAASGRFRRSCARAAGCALLAATLLPVGASAEGPATGGPMMRAFGVLPAGPGRPGTAWLDPAPLWEWRDTALQRRLEGAMEALGFRDALASRRLAVALVDVTDRRRPRVASLNGDTMLYAASLPKIAIMLALYQAAVEGRVEIDDQVRANMLRMIRYSSNEASTELMHLVGKEYIAGVLLAPRYRLYDPIHNGGLWAGKDYAKTGLWMRDPLGNLSHAATPMQVARFFYLLQGGQLVNPWASFEMKALLGDSAIEHKFVRGLKAVQPKALVFRKSGTWGQHHADGALVERIDGAAYIAVGLADHPRGDEWLSQIIIGMDRLISGGGPLRANPRLRPEPGTTLLGVGG